jgi:hypothetical protein
MHSRWVIVSFVILLSFGLILSSHNSVAASQTIPDVSWPNCTLNIAHARAGIVGIDGGLALRPNSCLAKEAADFSLLSVYVNTGYPGIKLALKYKGYPRHCSPSDEQCLAYNYGYNSGLYDVNYSLREGVIAKKWWLDVETDNSWSTNTTMNRQALSGTLAALSQFVGKDNLGFYSTPLQWQAINGQWYNGYPAWIGTGGTLKSDAVAACQETSFSGGPIVLTQYTPDLDANYICK